jgi:hypothetical protein
MEVAVIADPVIGEVVITYRRHYFHPSDYLPGQYKIQEVHNYGTSTECRLYPGNACVLVDYLHRVAWSFAGPLPVTWRTHDATPRGLGPVLSKR